MLSLCHKQTRVASKCDNCALEAYLIRFDARNSFISSSPRSAHGVGRGSGDELAGRSVRELIAAEVFDRYSCGVCVVWAGRLPSLVIQELNCRCA